GAGRHVQVPAHRRIERDLRENVWISVERILVEELQIGRHPAWMREIVTSGRDDDVVQGPSHPLAELVRSIHRVHEEPSLDRVRREIIACALIALLLGQGIGAGQVLVVRHEWQGRITGDGCDATIELLEYPGVETAEILNMLNR